MDSREAQRTTVEPAPRNGNGAATVTAPPTTTVETEERTGPRKRYIALVIGLIVAIALLLYGVRWFSYARAHESTDDARVDANVIQITSKITERVDQVLVDTNQPVHKGQLLIVLNSADERAKLDQAQANLQLAQQTQSAGTTQGSGGISQAQAEISNASAQVPAAQAAVAQAQAQVQVARAQVPAAREALNRAQADLARTESLVNSGDLPRQQLDAARAAAAQAAAQYRSALDNVSAAEANLQAAQSKVGAAVAGVSAAQGSLTTAQGKLSQAQAPAQISAQQAAVQVSKQQLSYTKIYSPVDGYVGERNVDVGQTVSPGTTLLTIIPKNGLFITANFKETQVGKMRPGQPVDITIDAYKGVKFHGHVVSINPASQNTYALVPAQNSTGNFVKVTQRIPVRIAVDDADPTKYPLRPGMSVEASVLTQ
jgi:membrane fusion protein (multidrug efflux system)